jgi:putative two-component system response regulator
MKNTKILIVEDETIIARNIANSLLSLGYQVPVIVSSGEGAIARAGELHPHIILMDIKLKGKIDGIEAADIIRTRFDIPVIYITSYADDETLEKAKATMPFGYIMKPPETRTLHSIIEMALYKHSAEKELNNYRRHLEKQVEERTEELKKSTDMIRKALNETVAALATTGELLGIYPAGHPKRVACLASTIASEMGLAEDGLHVMGLLHDIGKAIVPREILSKPVALSEIEAKLLQTHPEAGYDIVKGIEFPYPVATVILQHHEKMNGSGYPQGFAGDEIIPEARILAVAEAVESMATNQLFRPALGIDVALAKIEKNEGIFYDSGVVEVCLKLFREGGFKFE